MEEIKNVLDSFPIRKIEMKNNIEIKGIFHERFYELLRLYVETENISELQKSLSDFIVIDDGQYIYEENFIQAFNKFNDLIQSIDDQSKTELSKVIKSSYFWTDIRKFLNTETA